MKSDVLGHTLLQVVTATTLIYVASNIKIVSSIPVPSNYILPSGYQDVNQTFPENCGTKFQVCWI
jgi:hypothetical protein